MDISYAEKEKIKVSSNDTTIEIKFGLLAAP
jgi:hypothetical protein